MGTSSERKVLAEDINRAFELSLAKDKQKDEAKKIADEEKEMTVRELDLQKERKMRVPAEPSLEDPHAVISVRHPSMGTIRRIFPSKSTCNSIYDWVGSISPKPMYYRIYFENEDVKPWMNVEKYEKCVLNVAASEQPMELEEDDEITCTGFKQSDDIFSYADEEVANFLSSAVNIQNDRPSTPSPVVKCNCDKKDFLEQLLDERNRTETTQTVICHRRPSAFWRILFQQNISAEKPFRIIWAGEAGVDDGGPYREFLLNCMQNFGLLSGHFFGSSDQLLFTSLTDAVISKQYRLLGQLSALAISTIGRGPHCFHPAVVDYIFSGASQQTLSDVESAELTSKLSAIEHGERDLLLDADILPTNDQKRDIASFREYFCIISRAAGIEQFRQGISSINKQMLDKPCCIKAYFLKDDTSLTIADVRKLIEFKDLGEPGSNSYMRSEDAMIQFELFLVSLEQKEDNLELSDFLQFVAGVDRIPICGLPKNIEVFFVEDNKLPRVSTCGLLLMIPKTVTKEMLQLCIKESVGFENL